MGITTKDIRRAIEAYEGDADSGYGHASGHISHICEMVAVVSAK